MASSQGKGAGTQAGASNVGAGGVDAGAGGSGQVTGSVPNTAQSSHAAQPATRAVPGAEGQPATRAVPASPADKEHPSHPQHPAHPVHPAHPAQGVDEGTGGEATETVTTTGDGQVVVDPQNPGSTDLVVDPTASDNSAIANTPLGMTPVRSAASRAPGQDRRQGTSTVTMKKDGVSMDIDSRDVEAHRRMGWTL